VPGAGPGTSLAVWGIGTYDAAAFKAWLRQISQHVAEASKEGGFFSSGSPISDKEKATLQDISSALKLAA